MYLDEEQTIMNVEGVYTGFRHSWYAFRAPEVDEMGMGIENDIATSSPAIDIWGLGAILYMVGLISIAAPSILIC
jgi:hypothetical protein